MVLPLVGEYVAAFFLPHYKWCHLRTLGSQHDPNGLQSKSFFLGVIGPDASYDIVGFHTFGAQSILVIGIKGCNVVCLEIVSDKLCSFKVSAIFRFPSFHTVRSKSEKEFAGSLRDLFVVWFVAR